MSCLKHEIVFSDIIDIKMYFVLLYSGYVMTLIEHVTLSHLRSKEITGIHKPCTPHSNDSSATTEYKPVCIQM